MGEYREFRYRDTILVLMEGYKDDYTLKLPNGFTCYFTGSRIDLYAIPAIMLIVPHSMEEDDIEEIKKTLDDDVVVEFVEELTVSKAICAIDNVLRSNKELIIKARFKELFDLREDIIHHPDRFLFRDIEVTSLDQEQREVLWIKLFDVNRRALLSIRSTVEISEKIREFIGSEELNRMAMVPPHKVLMLYDCISNGKTQILTGFDFDNNALAITAEKYNFKLRTPKYIDISELINSCHTSNYCYKKGQKIIGNLNDIDNLMDFVLMDETELIEQLYEYILEA